MESQATTYNYKVVRQFAVMTVIWGVVGMLVGVIIAAQLVWPDLNFFEWVSYGRLRPLHTNAVILLLVVVRCLLHRITVFSALAIRRCSRLDLPPSLSGVGSSSSCLPLSAYRWALPPARNTPNLNGPLIS